MSKVYRIKDSDFKQIVKALKVKREDGTTKADDLFGKDGDCPICGHETEYDDKKKLTFRPFVVDFEHLQCRTRCCGCQMGPVNFVILSGKIEKGNDSVKRAMEWLMSFVKE